MKKNLLSALLAFSVGTSVSLHAQYLDNAKLQNMVGSYYVNTAAFFKGESWMLPVKYFAVSGAVGAGAGYILGANPAASKKLSSVGGLVTGTIGLLAVYLHRFMCVGTMDRFLKEYSKYSHFTELSDMQAIMLLGALNKDLSVMRRLVPYLSGFLREMGTWQVLTELYFDEPDSVINHSGSALTPGFSKSRGFYLNVNMHSSSSQVKHAYMRPEVMQRRMKTLQAKLGYTE